MSWTTQPLRCARGSLTFSTCCCIREHIAITGMCAIVFIINQGIYSSAISQNNILSVYLGPLVTGVFFIAIALYNFGKTQS